MILKNKNTPPTQQNSEILVDLPTIDVEETQGDPKSKGRAPKSRPTPKRKDAQRNYRAPILPPPKSRTEAKKRKKAAAPRTKAEKANLKAEQRTRNNENRMRQLAGEESYLLHKDRGPVKRYTRQLVDEKRILCNYSLPTMFVILLVSLVLSGDPAIAGLTSPIALILLVVFFGDGIFFGYKIAKKVKQKFPREKFSTGSICSYAFLRAIQPRKMRVPRLNTHNQITTKIDRNHK